MKLIDYIREKEKEAENKGLEKEAIKKILIMSAYSSLTNLIMNYDNEINSHYFNIYDSLVKEYLDNGKPVQYILGYTYFCGLKINVSPACLIPRPETELLVEIALEKIKEHDLKTVLDIGTGSGAIAIAIKKNSDTFVEASDISLDAIEIAKKNAMENGVDINFICSDVFDEINEKYDLIVSNPPYIDPLDIDKINKIVYQNEPHLALFGGEKGLYYYKRIIDDIDLYLNDGGFLIMEIGDTQAQDIKDYLRKNKENYKIDVYKDYNGFDRIVVIGK